MKRVAAADFEQVFDIDTLREPAALAAMQTFYQTHGVVCISLERKIDVREVVGEMLESLMGDLPYSDEYMLSLRSASGRELHIKNRDDREDMITELLRSPISPVNLKRLELAVPLIASSELRARRSRSTVRGRTGCARTPTSTRSLSRCSAPRTSTAT